MLQSVEQGGILQIQSDPTLYDFGMTGLPSTPMYDCVWVVKLPTKYGDRDRDEFKPWVYVTLLDMEIPGRVEWE